MKWPGRHCLGGCLDLQVAFRNDILRISFYLCILKFVITFIDRSKYSTYLNPSFFYSFTVNAFKRCLKPPDLVIYILKIKCVWLFKRSPNTRNFTQTLVCMCLYRSLWESNWVWSDIQNWKHTKTTHCMLQCLINCAYKFVWICVYINLSI